MLFEISQNSQENTCARSSFLIKACLQLNQKSLWHRFSCEFCEISMYTFFTEHLWTTLLQIRKTILCARTFQNSCIIEMGLSDLHRMILTAIKMAFQKLRSQVIDFRETSIMKIMKKTYRRKSLTLASDLKAARKGNL